MAITVGTPSAYNSADEGGAATNHDLTGFSVASGDDYLVVGIGTDQPQGGGSTASSVTIDPGGANEASLTKEINVLNTEWADLWYLDGSNMPPSGTYTVRVTLGGSGIVGFYVVALQGAADQAPEVSNSSQGSFPISTSVTTLTDDAVLFDAAGASVGSGFDQTTQETNQTEALDADLGSAHALGSYRPVGSAGSYAMGWDSDSGTGWVHAVMAVAPAGGGGGGGAGIPVGVATYHLNQLRK